MLSHAGLAGDAAYLLVGTATNNHLQGFAERAMSVRSVGQRRCVVTVAVSAKVLSDG